MNRQEKATKIKEILNTLFPNPKVPLNHKDSYTLLIAVLLSAQCQDKRVNEVTKILFKKADTPQKMVQITVREIEEIILPCGLFRQKAKAIWELSKILIENHRGKVPKNMKELEKLPGVGHKTASVVMAQAFNSPAFPVDTHIHRCAKRWALSDGKNVLQTERDLKKVFNKKDWIKLHLQIIYFARQYCTARGHKYRNCPICSWIKFEKSVK